MRATPILVLLSVFFLFAWNAIAQPQEPGFTERVDVEITNVDVFVRDASGDPVRGLTRDEFVLYEDGVKREIVNFAEIAPAQSRERGSFRSHRGIDRSVEPAPAARLVIYVENRALNHFSREDLLSHLEALVTTMTSRSVPVMLIVQDSFQPEVVAPFSTDPAQLRAALDALRRDEMVRSARTRPIGDARRTRRLSSLESTIEHLSALEGRKAMLFFFEDMPRLMSDEPSALRNRKRESRLLLVRNEGSGDLESDSYSTLPYLRRLVAMANEGKVTLYPVFGGGLSSAVPSVSGPELASQSVLGPRGAYGDWPMPMFNFQTNFASYEYLARETGGVATPPTSVFSFVTDQVERDLESYYSVGFRAGSSEPESSIRVEVREPGVTVRSRRAIYRRSDLEREQARTAAALFTGASLSGFVRDAIDIRASIARIEREGRRSIVIVELEIPLDDLVLTTTEGGQRGSIALLVAARDERGDLSPVYDQIHDLDLGALPETALRADHYVYELPLRMSRGEYRLSIRVLDRIGMASGARTLEVSVP